MARGSVRKRGKSWGIVYDIGPDPETGKRRQKREGSFRTKKEADAALTARQRAIDTGTALDPTKLTVGEYLAHWLVAGNPDLRAVTARTYRAWVRLHLVPHLGAVPLARLGAAQVDAWLVALRATLAPATARRVRALLVTALNAAVRWRLIAANPASPTRVPRAPAAEPRHWDTATSRRFLAAVADDPAAAPFVLALGTGLRRGELLGLRWDDLDLDRATLRVRRSRVRVGDAWVEDAPKNGKPRTIDLDAELVARLRAHRREQLAERLRHGDRWRDRGYVFAEPPWRDRDGGRPCTEDMLAHRFRRLVTRHGLPDLNLHGLRHTHATVLLEAGVHPKMVQERLGHASFAITMDLYAHATANMGKAAAEAFGRALAGG